MYKHSFKILTSIDITAVSGGKMRVIDSFKRSMPKFPVSEIDNSGYYFSTDNIRKHKPPKRYNNNCTDHL